MCKFIYNDTISRLYRETPVAGYNTWKTYFHNYLTKEEWLSGLKILYNTTKCTQTNFFQFRLLHHILVTKESRYRWNKTDDDICTLCNEEIESIPHILLECEVVKTFWTLVRQWLQDKTDILYTPSSKDIILGIENFDLNFINITYLLGKKYVYKCITQQEFPSLESFKMTIQNFYNIERTIAIKNSKTEAFELRWGPMNF